MKIDIKEIPTNKKKVRIKAYNQYDNFESELSKFLEFMSTSIEKRFRNKVLDQLNKKTVEKFTDAQIGNYAAIFNKLNNVFKKSINKQFSEKRINNYIKALYKRVDKANSNTFYKNAENGLGVDVKSIIKTDGLNTFVNAKTLETKNQIMKMLGEQTDNMSVNTLRLMSAGKSLDTLYDEVKNTSIKNKNKSELVARNELKTFNTLLSDKRASNLGITKATWNAVGGKRTRKCHQARDGKQYDIDKGLYSSCDGKTLSVGEEINCRCYATYEIDF